MKGTQKFEWIIWKKRGGGTGIFSFHGPYYLRAWNRLLAHWPEHNTLFSLHEVSSSIIIGAGKSKRIKLQHGSF